MLCGYPSFPIWTLPVLNFEIQREKLKLPTPSKEKHTWPSHFCLFTNIMSFVLSKPLIFYNRKSTSHARHHSTPSKTTKTHSRKINQHYYRVLFRLSWLNSHFDSVDSMRVFNIASIKSEEHINTEIHTSPSINGPTCPTQGSKACAAWAVTTWCRRSVGLASSSGVCVHLGGSSNVTTWEMPLNGLKRSCPRDVRAKNMHV